MTKKELREAVNIWDATSTEEDVVSASQYGQILEQLEFLGAGEWANYVPATNPIHSADFGVRLAEWVGNVPDAADRQLLLKYARQICYFSHDDILALCISAFKGPITRWVIKEAGLRFDSPQFDQQLTRELYQHTWYCPITDSMCIQHFYHINNITGIDRRPFFKDLEELSIDPVANTGNIDNLKTYIHECGLKRLVLLEDVVGSGSQSERAVTWAVRSLGIHVMFSPLIVCPKGAELARTLVNSFSGNLDFGPVIVLSRRSMLGPDREGSNSAEDAFAQKLEAFAVRTFSRVTGGIIPPPNIAPYGPFGCAQTGSSIVTHTNTPDNTLPLIHHRPPGRTWTPLFPRSSRI